jgi:hypothetical protein
VSISAEVKVTVAQYRELGNPSEEKVGGRAAI